MHSISRYIINIYWNKVNDIFNKLLLFYYIAFIIDNKYKTKKVKYYITLLTY
jgi:hypothetical protein